MDNYSSQSPKKRRWLLVLIVIIILAAGVVGGSLFFLQSGNKVELAKYTGPTFSVSYPSHLKPVIRAEGVDFLTQISNAKTTPQASKGIVMIEKTFTAADDVTLDKIEGLLTPPEKARNQISLERTEINGKPMVHVTNTSHSPNSIEDYYTAQGDEIWKLSFIYNKGATDFVNTISSIVSSFEVTK